MQKELRFILQIITMKTHFLIELGDVLAKWSIIPNCRQVGVDKNK